jgi:SAM-dependent methyltransferase
MSGRNLQQAYAEPDLYDLEHAEPERDVEFFVALARRWRPKRILEIGCGDGRVTLPLARAAAEWRGSVTGLDLSAEMLSAAREKDQPSLVEWVEGDMQHWRAQEPFDFILSPCGALGHLVHLAEQLATWRTAYANLAGGGRFVLSEPMANLPALAESMRSPARATVELDLDQQRGAERLLRYRATRYAAHEQRIAVHFLYDHFDHSDSAQRLASSYQGHVYFPNELQLLSIAAGFTVEAVWGDHLPRALRHNDRQIIVVSRRES